MKKSLVIILIIVFLIIIGVLLYSMREKTVTNREDLYEKAEEYLISLEEPQYVLKTKESSPDYDISDFKVFTNIQKLGIKQKRNQFYVYVWATVQSYYVQDNQLEINSGYSGPRKLIIENDEVIDCIETKDGTEYTKSIEENFPEDIREKMENLSFDNQKMQEEVNAYYSYILGESWYLLFIYQILWSISIKSPEITNNCNKGDFYYELERENIN